jgi:hypothetical protein
MLKDVTRDRIYRIIDKSFYTFNMMVTNQRGGDLEDFKCVLSDSIFFRVDKLKSLVTMEIRKGNFYRHSCECEDSFIWVTPDGPFPTFRVNDYSDDLELAMHVPWRLSLCDQHGKNCRYIVVYRFCHFKSQKGSSNYFTFDGVGNLLLHYIDDYNEVRLLQLARHRT